MLLALVLGSIGVLVQDARAQFVATPTGFTETVGHAGVPVRYKQVPTGICELDPNVKSFSGYADVAKDQHIFFWFFEARNQDPTTAPLTVWINGGPGSSSMIGLFQELGPCGVDYFGNVYNNPYSWSNASNLLFIDQPTQVGHSYSVPVPGYVDPKSGSLILLPNNTCPDYAGDSCGTYSLPDPTLTANSTANAAPNFWKTLQGFMGAFPQYARNGFHFTSESYGGHYGPVFNAYIEEQNAKDIPGAVNISLQSVMIGNGWYDPIIQYQAYYNFTVWPGNTYDYSGFNSSQAAQLYNNLYGPGNCIDRLQACKASGSNAICGSADTFCANNVENLYDIYLGRDEYDMRELMPDPFPYEFYTDYLNTPAVQEAIGAFVNFTEYTDAVGTNFGYTGDDGREVGTIEDIRALLGAGVTVALYAGDADYNCNWLGGEAVADEVGKEIEGWNVAGYVNLTTSDGIVHGQVKQAGRFSFTRVYESGHEVPFYQPVASLEMFDRVVKGLDVATGRYRATVGGKCFHTKGEKRSTYREGNATVQWSVVPTNVTYDTVKNGPGGLWVGGEGEGKSGKRRSLKMGRKGRL
ncbi:Alpha/Beta hydrolase protein [Podospora appendiculata]|uniref:Alpha/Beta hydrolase protein n=1 Tax=Podospora appendiculata TaxID=314037 RepID=A0AAE1CD30_9PEZI|nr:Alpha/Beta hydrolase protein [Podospora appendiculata]